MPSKSALLLGLVLGCSPATAQDCVYLSSEDPNECLVARASAAPAPSLPSGYSISRGPLGGVTNVPDGYFVCALYDRAARHCQVRAVTEAELEEVGKSAVSMTAAALCRQRSMTRQIGLPEAAMDDPYGLCDTQHATAPTSAPKSEVECLRRNGVGGPAVLSDDQIRRAVQACLAYLPSCSVGQAVRVPFGR